MTEYALPTKFTQPYDVIWDKNGELWTGGMTTDRVVRLDPKTGEAVEYPLAARYQHAPHVRRQLDAARRPSGSAATTAPRSCGSSRSIDVRQGYDGRARSPLAAALFLSRVLMMGMAMKRLVVAGVLVAFAAQPPTRKPRTRGRRRPQPGAWQQPLQHQLGHDGTQRRPLGRRGRHPAGRRPGRAGGGAPAGRNRQAFRQARAHRRSTRIGMAIMSEPTRFTAGKALSSSRRRTPAPAS